MVDFHTPELEISGSEVGPGGTVEMIVRDALPLLNGLARGRCGLDEEQADSLVHGILVQYLGRASEIRDPRSYLVASLMNGARRVKSAGRSPEIPLEEMLTEPEQASEDDDRRILVGQILDRMDERCREVLKMHYFRGQTTREMAEELATTPGYAQKLVHKCLSRALEICRKIKVTRAL